MDAEQLAQLQRWCFVSVGAITILFAMALGSESELIATKTEGEAISKPAAKLLAHIEWVRIFLARYGHLISLADDSLLLLMAISMYVERVAPILGNKFARARGSRDRRPLITRQGNTGELLRKGAGLFAARDTRETGSGRGRSDPAGGTERRDHLNGHGGGEYPINGVGGPGGTASSPFGQYQPDL